ncbi:MAG: hypothetical protein B6I36_10045 [Desulfobacteraceae bacterium 4572_35.1]|nr:MAG: hypothetical protein B6I36_10045 [Desulfobacteraceae bacterium 4572_35.1]
MDGNMGCCTATPYTHILQRIYGMFMFLRAFLPLQVGATATQRLGYICNAVAVAEVLLQGCCRGMKRQIKTYLHIYIERERENIYIRALCK